MIAPLLALLQAAQMAAVPLEGGARNPAFSLDGRVAIEARGDIWIAETLRGLAEWTRVTSGVAWDRAPAWTADGSAIVFSSDRAGNFDLWRIDVPRDGAAGEPRRITTSPDPDGDPAVAPDGSIIFVRGRAQGADLWARTPAGEERRLTREPGAERAPAISPDGRRVAYAALRSTGSRVRIIGVDGSDDRALFADQDGDYPAWSPDGGRIAFAASGQRAGVWVADADGRWSSPLSTQRGAPAWSPDGDAIVIVEMPSEGGGYNGDPDRIGDRDVGDVAPSVGRMWLVEAPRLASAPAAEVSTRVRADRPSLNAEVYDRLISREERLYFSTADATQRRDQWRALAAKHRPRALAARTDAELDDAVWALLRERPPLRAPATGRAAVSSAHPVATAAGLEAFRKGGNVVDAAVAVSFALGVVEPDASGIGGYGQMLIYRRGMEEPTAIEFMTAVPELASVTNREFPPGGRLPADGPVLANIPGTVAGMELAWKKYGSGKVTWADLIAPAIRAAEDGYVISDGFATTLSYERESYLKYEGSRALFFRDRDPLRAGDTLRNPDLAWTLREIAKGGADAFYRGTVAQRMVADLSGHGNAIRLSDLERYAAREARPVSGTFRGNAIYSSVPPVSGGASLVAQLNALEHFQSPRPYTEDAASLHAVIEAWKLAPRGARIADPALWPVNLEPAVSKDSARARWRCFDPRRASTAETMSACGAAAGGRGAGAGGRGRGAGAPPPSAGGGSVLSMAPVAPWSPTCDNPDQAIAPRICRSTGTTAYVVADGEGNIVSTTQTLGTWGGNFYVSPGLGFIYNDKVGSYGGGDASTPGARVAGARHGSTIAPTIVFRGSGANKRPWFGVGAAGNAWITSAVYQTLVGIVDGGLSPQAALELPRFQASAAGGRGGGAQGMVTIEAGVSPEVIRTLQSMGHRFQFISLPGEVRQGYGAAVVVENGRATAGADPRRAGAAGAIPR
jgi:gamma-glutamyltranspeptidase